MSFSYHAPTSSLSATEFYLQKHINCHKGQVGRLTKDSRTGQNLVWILNLWCPYLKEMVLCYQVLLKILDIISLPISTQSVLISDPNNICCPTRHL